MVVIMKEKADLFRKQGFSIVELVIVIAVIAILAAVLVPTFTSVIRSADRSRDISAVTNMNKALQIGEAGKTGVALFTSAESILADCGFTVPRSANLSHCTYYWMPEQNRVVLYDTKKETVLFPEEYEEMPRSAGWVDLGTGGTYAADEPGGNPGVVPDEEPENLPAYYTLPDGSGFCQTVLALCSSPTQIVFGKSSDHPALTDGVAMAEGIVAYRDGTIVYVLSKTGLALPGNASGMFSNMTSLTTVDFGSIKTDSVTNMSKMFYNCSELTGLNLCSFNTAKVTKTESMFENCSKLKQILVSNDRWDVKGVSPADSFNMFAGCRQLPNYEEKIYIPLVSDILGSIFSGITPDSTYAHTASGGYLTAG